jgi:hypothetical protein
MTIDEDPHLDDCSIDITCGDKNLLDRLADNGRLMLWAANDNDGRGHIDIFWWPTCA